MLLLLKILLSNVLNATKVISKIHNNFQSLLISLTFLQTKDKPREALNNKQQQETASVYQMFSCRNKLVIMPVMYLMQTTITGLELAYKFKSHCYW